MPERIMVAKAILVNSDNKFLKLICSEWPERPDRSLKPDLPGGLVEVGESAWDGVRREVIEETGIELAVTDYHLLYAHTHFSEKENESISKLLFIARVSTKDVKLSWEHESYEWLDWDAFYSLEWRPFYRDALMYCTEYNLIKDFSRS